MYQVCGFSLLAWRHGHERLRSTAKPSSFAKSLWGGATLTFGSAEGWIYVSNPPIGDPAVDQLGGQTSGGHRSSGEKSDWP
jgi:hypothetical protein